MNRLYVFYNMELSKDGAPFAMCDKHKKTYRYEGPIIMKEIATHASMPCHLCPPEVK